VKGRKKRKKKVGPLRGVRLDVKSSGKDKAIELAAERRSAPPKVECAKDSKTVANSTKKGKGGEIFGKREMKPRETDGRDLFPRRERRGRKKNLTLSRLNNQKRQNTGVLLKEEKRGGKRKRRFSAHGKKGQCPLREGKKRRRLVKKGVYTSISEEGVQLGCQERPGVNLVARKGLVKRGGSSLPFEKKKEDERLPGSPQANRLPTLETGGFFRLPRGYGTEAVSGLQPRKNEPKKDLVHGGGEKKRKEPF